MFQFPVVPVCDAQRKDVADSHLLTSGLYRSCNTYKAGGGYDQFPAIYTDITGESPANIGNQFVVQLRGCPLSCKYCYVTPAGVWGKETLVSAEKLVQDFKESGCGTFHLMGGAPASYYEHWYEILDLLPSNVPFHSDFVLCEKPYQLDVLKLSARYRNGVYAVSLKGDLHWYEEQKIKVSLLFDNMELLDNSGIQYYVTFTGMNSKTINFWKRAFSGICDFHNSFSIGLIEYEALKEAVA